MPRLGRFYQGPRSIEGKNLALSAWEGQEGHLGLDGAWWDAEELFEVAGEVGELFIAEVVGDAFGSFAILKTGVGEVQAHLAEALPDCGVIMFDEMAFEGSEGYTASTGE
jgi:hypothetical protein